MNKNTETEQQKPDESKDHPDDIAGFYISGFLRIRDPQTNKILVETRTD
jgi:hypothetical protein